MRQCPACGARIRLELTREELRVTALLGEGFHVKDIAQELRKAARTVKGQLRSVYIKLGLMDERRLPYVRLAVWWNCELFQLGLRELGMREEIDSSAFAA
jgi:DNA-binding NarL/FixJ family response regulator